LKLKCATFAQGSGKRYINRALDRGMNYYHPRPFRRLWMEFRA